jgi:hypothetical protein
MNGYGKTLLTSGAEMGVLSGALVNGHADFFRGAVWVKALLAEFGAVHWALKLQGLLFFAKC